MGRIVVRHFKVLTGKQWAPSSVQHGCLVKYGFSSTTVSVRNGNSSEA